QHANLMATTFKQQAKHNIEYIHPVEANEVFCRLPTELIKQLQALGFEFHIWPGHSDVIRLVFSHATERSQIDQLTHAINKYQACE
ncbi:hypothetical protein MNBD_GAMMA02-1573, partial [hydrothermal vent metagenome]